MGTLVVNIDKEVVRSALGNAEEVKLRVRGISTEKDTSFVALYDSHLYLVSEIAKSWSLGVAWLKVTFRGHA